MRISDWSSDVCSSDLRLQKVANWTIGLSLCAVAAIAAHATGVTAKIHEEYAQAVGRAGFQVRKVEVVGADRIDRLKVYDIALAQKDRSMAAVDLEIGRASCRERVCQYV